jgi:hypothetical protein
LASLIVWPKVPSIVDDIGAAKEWMPANMTSLTAGKIWSKSSHRQASSRLGGGLTTDKPSEIRCLRPTIDFVSLETVEKSTEVGRPRQNTRACAHGAGLATVHGGETAAPLKMAAASQAFIPRCVTPPSSLG